MIDLGSKFWRIDAEAVGIADALQKAWTRSGGTGSPPWPMKASTALAFGIAPEAVQRAVEHADARRGGA